MRKYIPQFSFVFLIAILFFSCSHIKTETQTSTFYEPQVNEIKEMPIDTINLMDKLYWSQIYDSAMISLLVPKTAEKQGSQVVEIPDSLNPENKTTIDFNYSIYHDSGAIDVKLRDIHILSNKQKTITETTRTIEKRFYERLFFIAMGAAAVLIIVVGIFIFFLIKKRK